MTRRADIPMWVLVPTGDRSLPVPHACVGRANAGTHGNKILSKDNAAGLLAVVIGPQRLWRAGQIDDDKAAVCPQGPASMRAITRRSMVQLLAPQGKSP